ncbi:hypothetical protein OPQ81_004806 [Rhizoctonia solani]|nr:hypothetical protein OPQ81_004806 [Rhizoctonia solani]
MQPRSRCHSNCLSYRLNTRCMVSRPTAISDIHERSLFGYLGCDRQGFGHNLIRAPKDRVVCSSWSSSCI